MPRAPKIVDGLRGPEQSPRNVSAGGLPAPPPDAMAPAKVGKRVFASRFAGHYLQLLTIENKESMDSQGRGVVIPGRSVKVRFEEGVLTLDPVKDAEKIGLLENHPRYRTDFWDAAEVDKMRKEEEATAFVQTFEAKLKDPEFRERFRQTAKKRTFAIAEDVEAVLASAEAGETFAPSD